MYSIYVSMYLILTLTFNLCRSEQAVLINNILFRISSHLISVFTIKSTIKKKLLLISI